MLGSGPLGAAPLGSEQIESGDVVALVATMLSPSSITAELSLLVGLSADVPSGSSITCSLSRSIDLGLVSVSSGSSATGTLESEDLLRLPRTDIEPFIFWR